MQQSWQLKDKDYPRDWPKRLAYLARARVAAAASWWCFAPRKARAQDENGRLPKLLTAQSSRPPRGRVQLAGVSVMHVHLVALSQQRE